MAGRQSWFHIRKHAGVLLLLASFMLASFMLVEAGAARAAGSLDGRDEKSWLL
ncbi:hypothetical protein [Actinoplanes sp. NPDC089786]|uniref:hypothetical protein n=1 Tax=Actinoplanes sp. NPDC089786 TaxID=3155185 RepID=UPI003412F7F5